MSQRMFQKLVYNRTGQVLEWYPPDALVMQYGAPAAAATYTVFAGTTSNDGTSEFSGTATADVTTVDTTVSTTAAGYAQANRKTVKVASSTGVTVGLRFALSNASTQREIVTPLAVDSSPTPKVVTADADLNFDYPVTTSTFKGLRQYFTVDATFIATAGKINVFASLAPGYLTHRQHNAASPAPPYRVRWVYSLNSITREDWTYFDVVRQAGSHHVTASDLRERYPGLLDVDWSDQRGLGYQRQIDAAWDLFCFDVNAAGYDVDAITEGPTVDEMVRQLSLAVIQQAKDLERSESSQLHTDLYKRYREMFDSAVRIPKVWLSLGSTGEISSEKPAQPFLRR